MTGDEKFLTARQMLRAVVLRQDDVAKSQLEDFLEDHDVPEELRCWMWYHCDMSLDGNFVWLPHFYKAEEMLKRAFT